MNVLIIEDDENKRVQLNHYLAELLVYPSISMERSLQSGIRSMRNHPSDIVILDMTLPNYDPEPDDSGGQTHIFGGREFLRQMDRFDISAPVIVVTQFEAFGKTPKTVTLSDLDRELRMEHPGNYKGVVYYHAGIHGWKDSLNTLLRTVVERSKFRD